MGRQHIKDGAFHVTAKKNKAELVIPIDEELAAAMAAAPRGNLTLLVTQTGKPFTPAGFGNWFADEVKAAGLPTECVAHGLRKAKRRQLAESGATEKEIMATIGDKDPRAAALYTAAADQRLLAEAAAAKLRGAKREQKLANQDGGFANPADKRLEGKTNPGGLEPQTNG
jgi:site-specific recombinase XerD